MEPLFCIDFSPEQATRLLEIARDSIRHGLVARWPPRVAPADCIGALGERLGGFVTLTKKSVLRGCVRAAGDPLRPALRRHEQEQRRRTRRPLAPLDPIDRKGRQVQREDSTHGTDRSDP